MEEEIIDCFSNIQYTPAWYWTRFPGFFNVESYRILAAWDKGVRTEEELERQNTLEEEELGVEEEKEDWCVEEKEDYYIEEGGSTKKRKA
jgi:hypothetical protein